jgi:hypothetical protein
MLFDYKHYVPALKWRKGEYKALFELSASQKSRLTPLIEIPGIAWDFENDVPSKTVDQHLAQTINQISANWGAQPAFVDAESVQAETMSTGQHPMLHLGAQGQTAGLNLIPVTGLDRDASYQAAVLSLLSAGYLEVAIRLRTSSIFSPQLDSNLQQLMTHLGVSAAQVHLILDFQALDQNSSSVLGAALPLAIQSSALIQQVATVTFLATGFPPNLSEISPGIGVIPRLEWSIWLQHLLTASRKLTFGDYTISHSESVELDPRTMRVSASIRYTSDTQWVIFRGYWLQHPAHSGYSQFHDLSLAIVQHPAYSGSTFSSGDQCIWDCAQQTSGTGNLTTWRQAGTNHHLVFVTNQVANLP